MQYQAPAPPSRMAYGAQPRQEQIARNELLAGAEPAAQSMQPMSQDDMNSAQLMHHAVDTHKETTATAQRALKIVEQTKEIQASTHVALRDQGEQMYRIEQDMDRIGEDLSYSERILRFMKLCCCVGFFCSCCTEPNRAPKDSKWRGSSHQPQQPSHPASSKQPATQLTTQKQRQQQQAGAAGSAAYPGVSTRGLADAGFGEQAAVIDDETKKQDQYLDEISKGLDQLKFGAQRMNEELRVQEVHADRIRGDADMLQSKLQQVNREGFKRI